MAGFDVTWAEFTVRELRSVGVTIAAGLSESDIDEMSHVFGCPVPEELSTLLRVGVPVSERWTPWHDGAVAVHRQMREWTHRAFAFDIENDGYWHPSFGDRPAELEAAVRQALVVVDSAPALFPVFGHRFLCSAPAEGPRAVLSVWQAVDSIFYGFDLADYFAREFKIPRPAWAATAAPSVPIWGPLFEL